MTANEAGTTKWDTNTFTITLDKIPAGQTWWIRIIQSTEQQALQPFKLNEIDQIRDKILSKPGNTTYTIGKGGALKLESMFAERGINNKLKSTRPQYGLLLKTYNSDLYQNWINTEWIEGYIQKLLC